MVTWSMRFFGGVAVVIGLVGITVQYFGEPGSFEEQIRSMLFFLGWMLMGMYVRNDARWDQLEDLLRQRGFSVPDGESEEKKRDTRAV